MANYTMTSNGVEESTETSNLSEAKHIAERWVPALAGVTLWLNSEPVAEYPCNEGRLVGDGQGSRKFSHGPWVTL